MSERQHTTLGPFDVWFDADSAITVRAPGPAGAPSELSIPLDGSYELGIEDEKLLDAWVAQGILSKRAAKNILIHLRAPRESRDVWLRGHGLQKLLARTHGWSDTEMHIVDLHFHYMAYLWNMNDWKIYNRYKKHLPAERRGEVDAWINLRMTGASDETLREALEAILVTIWDADDWEKAIRDPKLLQHEPLEPDELEEWQRLLQGG